jgi:hypothetical protein
LIVEEVAVSPQQTTSGRTALITVRLPEEIVLKIRKEADRTGMTVNEVTKQVLINHIRWGPYAEKTPFLPVPTDMLNGMLRELPDETITGLARNAGNALLRRLGLFRGSLGPGEMLGLLSDWLEPSGMRVECTVGEGGRCVILHDLGRKWSLYLASLLDVAVKTVSNSRLSFDVGEDRLTLKLTAGHKY